MSELKAARHLSQWISEGALFRTRIACFCPESSMYSETMKPTTLSSHRDGERMAVLELEAQAGERTATTTLSNVAHTIIICTWSQALYSTRRPASLVWGRATEQCRCRETTDFGTPTASYAQEALSS